jgi:hypothetical protein
VALGAIVDELSLAMYHVGTKDTRVVPVAAKRARESSELGLAYSSCHQEVKFAPRCQLGSCTAESALGGEANPKTSAVAETRSTARRTPRSSTH